MEALEIQLKHKLKSKLVNLNHIDKEIDNLNEKTNIATSVLYSLENYDDVVASLIKKYSSVEYISHFKKKMKVEEEVREEEQQEREEMLILESLSTSQYGLKGLHSDRFEQAEKNKYQHTVKKGHYLSLDSENYKKVLLNHESINNRYDTTKKFVSMAKTFESTQRDTLYNTNQYETLQQAILSKRKNYSKTPDCKLYTLGYEESSEKKFGKSDLNNVTHLKTTDVTVFEGDTSILTPNRNIIERSPNKETVSGYKLLSENITSHNNLETTQNERLDDTFNALDKTVSSKRYNVEKTPQNKDSNKSMFITTNLALSPLKSNFKHQAVATTPSCENRYRYRTKSPRNTSFDIENSKKRGPTIGMGVEGFGAEKVIDISDPKAVIKKVNLTNESVEDIN